MVDKIKQKRGKTSRAQGAAFETRVRADLEEKGWIVDKWTNNVVFEEDTKRIVEMGRNDYPKIAKGINYGKLIPAKPKFLFINGGMRMVGNSSGFPDFIAIRVVDEDMMPGVYEVIGVESKMTGELDREEKDKCKWLLENNIFSKILIASKHKIKNRIHIEYEDFTKKYWRFYK